MAPPLLPTERPDPTMTTRTLDELAALVGATLEGDGSRAVVGPAALAEAGEDEVSFLGNPRYLPLLSTTRAAGVLVDRVIQSPRGDLTLLRCDDPGRAFTRIIEAFAAPAPARPPGVDPSAWVDPSATLEEGVHVGPLCILEAGAVVERGAVLVARVYVGRESRVGPETVLHPGVALYPGVSVGARCILHAGCVIGADGFGFDRTEAGWIKVPQCGTVAVEDDVEIGANSAIDRGRFGATRVGRGTKIDNLTHVAHNCILEEDTLLCAQVGLAGTTRIGRGAILGGQAGVIGHVAVGPGARIGGQAGVTSDVPPGQDWTGWPARPSGEVLRAAALSRRLPELAERVHWLEKRLARLEEEAL